MAVLKWTHYKALYFEEFDDVFRKDISSFIIEFMYNNLIMIINYLL